MSPIGLERQDQMSRDVARPERADRPPLVVVSNREPYLHTRADDGRIVWTTTTGGVAVALDALMRERGGVWIAHGEGSADREVVDRDDHVAVPPDAPSYQLRRIWLSEQEVARYYGGFSNEGLWPLCHVVHVRPEFRAADWSAYKAVNARFARAVDEELTDPLAPVFIQDYHLALLAPALRQLRPDVRTAIFWHIPWPDPDRLRICPWRKELVRGLLANNLVAFQLERDRRNFLRAAQELGLETDFKAGTVSERGRQTTVFAVPIGIDFERIQTIAADEALDADTRRLKREFKLDVPIVGVGVDRLDYTKGIPERLAAIDLLLRRNPELRGQLAFVQIGVPSRSKLTSYRSIEREIDGLVDDINRRHAIDDGPGPIRYRKSSLKIRSLVALYRLADFCIVSSLHDGMNLVAKEFVAARDDNDGVLVLSELAGAAQELGEALLINPYDVEGFADALRRALDMPKSERAQRMRALRVTVAGADVFGWASGILEGLEHLATRPPVLTSSKRIVAQPR